MTVWGTMICNTICGCNQNISSTRAGYIYGESMLYNYKLYLQCFISLTWIRRGRLGLQRDLCYMYVHGYAATAGQVMGSTVKWEPGRGGGSVCINVAEDELGSH